MSSFKRCSAGAAFAFHLLTFSVSNEVKNQGDAGFD